MERGEAISILASQQEQRLKSGSIPLKNTLLRSKNDQANDLYQNYLRELNAASTEDLIRRAEGVSSRLSRTMDRLEESPIINGLKKGVEIALPKKPKTRWY
jgi:hypothetical protein